MKREHLAPTLLQDLVSKQASVDHERFNYVDH